MERFVKINSLVIKNVASYGPRTEFHFDKRINTFIGPNGGGKTNLQRIIGLTLSKYFIHQYQFRRDENVTGVELIDAWTQRNLTNAFPRYLDDQSEQIIEIEFIPETQDIENIRTIGTNLDKFNKELAFWEKKYEQYAPLLYVAVLSQEQSIRFTIRDLQLIEPDANTAAWAFREYLREFFIFLRVAGRIPDLELSSPVFFFSSERAPNRGFEVQAGQITEQAYFEGYRSAYQAALGDSMNLMQWGTQHFVRLHRRSVIEASTVNGKTWTDVFWEYEDVKLLSKYLQQLGYTWGFRFDSDQTSYWFHLMKDGRELYPGMFSSGEREIVHFLLAMFALNVKDGLVLVDEPELHLHPRWQKIFLSLFREISPERNNQIIVTTHSPAFVTPETIDSVTRVYRSPNGSTRIALRDVELPEKKTLVRMINSQNNERLFFADRVALVEGISDRLVLESIIDSVCNLLHISLAIEVVEVGGKHNFPAYETILKGLLTPVVTIADRDYLMEVGSAEVAQLFVQNADDEWKVLTADKKSTDRVAMMSHLETAIASTDLTQLRKFWQYFRSRHKTLRYPLRGKEENLLAVEYAKLRTENVIVLKRGEIESYLPPGGRDLRGIVELIRDPNWLNSVEPQDARVELAEIVCEVLGLIDPARNSLLQMASAATFDFKPLYAL